MKGTLRLSNAYNTIKAQKTLTVANRTALKLPVLTGRHLGTLTLGSHTSLNILRMFSILFTS